MIFREQTLSNEEQLKLVEILAESIGKIDAHYKTLDKADKLAPEDTVYKNELNQIIENLVNTLHAIKHGP